MLDLIRRKKKSGIIKIIFWFIIATFVGTIFLVWGKGEWGPTTTANLAARVNNSEISRQAYDGAYSNLYRFFQSIYQERFTPELERQLGLREQALDLLIERALLGQEADRRGIQVSRQEVIDSIAAMPQFQENGVFSKDRYVAVLNIQRLTPEMFEAEQRLELRLAKLREALRGEVSISDADVEESFRLENETINLALLRFRPAPYAARVKPDPEALAAWYAAHQEEFRRPERVALSYVRFEPARYRDEAEPSATDLERFYRRHLDRYELDEEAQAAHILIEVRRDASEAERAKRRERAELVLAKARAGEDFATLARTYSDDPGSARQGGDLGSFGRGVMVAPFDAAVFSRPLGTIGDLVETDFGYHILRVNARTEAGVRPLAEVVDDVRRGARDELATRIAFEKALDAYNLHRKEGTLAQAAAAFDLTPVETGLFSREDTITGLGRPAEIMAAAFALEPGKLARPVQVGTTTYLFSVREHQPSAIPELAEVRAAAEQGWRAAEARNLAAGAAAAALAALRAGTPLAQVAREHQLTVEETGAFAQSSGPAVPRIGVAEGLLEAAFALTREQPVPERVFTVGDEHFVIRLQDRQEADLALLDASRREQLRESLLSTRREQYLQDFIKQLRDNARLEIFISLDRGQP